MNKKIKLSIDAMCADLGVSAIIEGANIFIKNKNDAFLNFYGNYDEITKNLQLFPDLVKSSLVVHSDSIVPNDAKPSSVLRSYKNSSMRMAIDAAKQGETDGIVSCGNTGALMVMSKAFIGTLKDIDRPAILAVMPTMKNDLAMLDLGANIMCDAEILSQFAIMGNAYSKVVMQIESPSVAILNVGSESTKGKPEIKQAAAILQNNKNINFVGYIEPDEMFYGNVDVIITDGFSGNISLKTAEGVSMLIKNIVKEEAASMPFYEKIGFSIAKTFFKRINQRVDRRNFNGGPLLGIDSVVVKSHGSADSIAFSNAINVAYKMVKNDINKKISAEIEGLI